MSFQQYWIHCNKCFELFVRKKTNFHLLSCSHILCESCLSKCGKEDGRRNCQICKRPIVSIRICPEMSPKYSCYFTPDPWKSGSLVEVTLFQMFHSNNLYKGISRADMYCEQIKKEVKQLMENTTQMIKVDKDIKKVVPDLEAKAAKYRSIDLPGTARNK